MSDEYISKEQFVSHYRKLLCEDCKHRKQYRNGKLINRFVYEIGGPPCRACEIDDMLDRVEDFEPADVAPVPRWIPVTERYPSHAYGEGDSVLTVSKLGVMRVLYFDGGNWCYPTGEPTRKYQITHWMPLPEPPKEET